MSDVAAAAGKGVENTIKKESRRSTRIIIVCTIVYTVVTILATVYIRVL